MGQKEEDQVQGPGYRAGQSKPVEWGFHCLLLQIRQGYCKAIRLVLCVWSCCQTQFWALLALPDRVGVFSVKLGLLPAVQQTNNYTLERDTHYVFQSYTCLGAEWYFIDKAHPTRDFPCYYLYIEVQN